MVTVFERGQYLSTYFDTGIGMSLVYYRVVKVHPKMVSLMFEHGERPFRMTKFKAEPMFDLCAADDWHPEIKI